MMIVYPDYPGLRKTQRELDVSCGRGPGAYAAAEGWKQSMMLRNEKPTRALRTLRRCARAHCDAHAQKGFRQRGRERRAACAAAGVRTPRPPGSPASPPPCPSRARWRAAWRTTPLRSAAWRRGPGLQNSRLLSGHGYEVFGYPPGTVLGSIILVCVLQCRMTRTSTSALFLSRFRWASCPQGTTTVPRGLRHW